MIDIFQTLPVPPVDKDEACNYERIFGLYFIINGVHTLGLENFVTKIHGNRF
jgi:hypothetical protein